MENTIGKRIKHRRKALKITQRKVQQETSISTGNLSCIENGKYLPSAVALMELSKVLGCSVDWLLTGNIPVSCNTEILDNEERMLLDGYRELSKDSREEILEILQMKLRRMQK